MKRNIEINTLKSGQRRPYADHCDIVEITFTMWRDFTPEYFKLNPDKKPGWVPMFTNPKMSEPKVRAFIRAWLDVPVEPKTCFDRRITSLSMIREGVWKVQIDAAYTG